MIQGLWVALILMFLLMSVTGFSGAFLGVIVVFYVPIILGFLYMIWDLVGTLWFVMVLTCFVILCRLDYLLYYFTMLYI